MSLQLKIKKGLDLELAGKVESDKVEKVVIPDHIAIFPDDFPGLTPKLNIKEGDPIRKGQPLFHDKVHEEMNVVSPVTGTIKEIVRGERRKIIRIVIAVDQQNYDKGISQSVNPTDDESVIKLLMQSGMWVIMRQLPFGIIPDPQVRPRDIFIAGFDSSPLAPDFDVLLKDKVNLIVAGVELLNHLTDGKVYVTRRRGSRMPDIPGAEMIDIDGPHPAGNIGTAIANIAPVNKGEVVWTLSTITAARIGTMIRSGAIAPTSLVAVTGSEVKHPEFIRTLVGAPLKAILEGNLKDDDRHKRYISGNLLTGINVGPEGYIRWPFYQVTVIPEGDDVAEFMGWASLSPSKMSVSRSFPGHFLHRLFSPDARIKGGRRAMIMSGEYESVMPMDILPEYLIKAILSKDIDNMEKLGIYEVIPEDFALAEYVDTSKLELQKIVAEGLEYLRKETE
ncbi:MAG: Na(+)-translocating NADH-quinone reductase subunit A [Muribaculaceae bacterium]|nr:Na(+)-translocating NADH-quinone reductase subunit A [Muribaculaceae bacterium]